MKAILDLPAGGQLRDVAVAVEAGAGGEVGASGLCCCRLNGRPRGRFAHGFRGSPTRSGILRGVVGVTLVASAFSLYLFGECEMVRNSRALGNILGEVAAALTDAGTQWMVFLCAGIYLFAFTVLRGQQGSRAATGEDGRWRGEDGYSACGARGKCQYFRLPDTLVGRSGGTGQGGLCAGLRHGGAIHAGADVAGGGGAGARGGVVGKAESRRQKAEIGAEGRCLALIILLAGAAVWQAETGHLFQYRGQARWSGPWDNPNTFGVLMGVGVLAVGGLVQSR